MHGDLLFFLFHISTLCRPGIKFSLVANKWSKSKRNGKRRRLRIQVPPANIIHRNIDAETVNRLHLRKAQLEIRHPLGVPNEPVRDIYLLENGIASVTTLSEDGFEVETGMYGKDSLSGISTFMGVRESLNASYIQIAGHGYSCKIDGQQKSLTALASSCIEPSNLILM